MKKLIDELRLVYPEHIVEGMTHAFEERHDGVWLLLERESDGKTAARRVYPPPSGMDSIPQRLIDAIEGLAKDLLNAPPKPRVKGDER